MSQQQHHQAAEVKCDGLLIYCSDFRFWRVAFNYMIEDLKIATFDILCYPGSAANLCRDLSGAQLFLEKIRFLHNRHQFHTLVMANHTDCGGYGDRSGFHSPEAEKQVHLTDLLSAKSRLLSEFPHLTIIPLYISQTPNAIQVERVL